MEKFKPTVIAKEFITAASDALVTQNALVFNDGVGSSTILTDDQALNNNYKNSQSISKDVPTSVSGYKNVDTNTIVANVKISNKTLPADVRISTILIYASYNGNNILAATARLNAPELLPAYDTDKGTPVTLEFAVYMQVSNNINAPVQFNEAGLATSADLMAVDASAVHTSGDETIDGIKKFLKPINGTAEITIHYLWDDLDLNTLVDNSVYVANNVKVLQSSVKENFIMRVEAGNSKFPVKQTKYSFDTGMTYVRYQNNGSWTNFIKQPTDDSVLVHLFGDETIDGNKTFLKNIATTSDNSMINGGGNDKSLALVKQSGTQPFVAFGNTNQVQIKKSNNAAINPTDTFKTILNITDNGQVNVGVNQDLVPLDKNVTHKSGDETVGGNKTFTGNTSFSGGLKGGQVNLPATGDLNTLTDTGKYYQTTSVNASNWTNRPSNTPNLAFSVDVIGQANGSLATQVYYVHTTSRMWVRTMWLVNGTTRSTSQWAELANDNNVVHNTGTETVAGDKTFLKKIQGSITNADVADVRTNSISDNQDISKITTSGYYAGRNVNNVQGIPSANFNGKYFDLTVWVYGTNGFAFIVDDNDHMYFRKRQNSVWLDYHSMPINDTKLVHNSGNETIYDKKTFDAVTTFNNGIVNKPISMNGVKMDVSELVSGSYNVWQNDISGCPAGFGVVEVFENVSNTMYRFTETDLPDPHIWVQIRNSFGFSGWKNTL